MCGIAGFYATAEAASKVRAALTTMASRGKEAAGLYDGLVTHVSTPADLPYSGSESALGHVLHAMVGCVAQPVQGKGVLVANCEIYNWKALAAHEGISAENDTQVLLHLLDKHYPDIDAVLIALDGVYAFAYERDGVVTLARDILGVKPLYYTASNGFAFASERKALTMQGYAPRELHPRTVLQYDTAAQRITEHNRAFFAITPEHTEPYDAQRDHVAHLLKNAVAKRVPDAPFGVLLSGGLDSSLLALLLAKHKPLCYVVGVEGAPDVAAATALARELGLQLRVLTPTAPALADALPTIVRTIEDGNPVKVSVAATLWFACAAAQQDGCRALFSGLGADELFGGYARIRKSTALNRDCLAALRKLHERDLYRDDTITMRHGIELRLPFLDRALVEYALKIPAEHKLRTEEKAILRDAARALGLAEAFSARPKKAAQYGSGTMKLLLKLAKDRGQSLAEYTTELFGEKNKKLASMLSTGKDSVFALHIMHRMQYPISCVVTIESENPDSYMYHTPNVHLAQLQADAMGIPLITAKTRGQKEAELDALTHALREAQQRYGVEGVVVGAIASQYQRERVETVCDALGLTVFAPLWQMDQVQELRALINDEFSVVFTKVAADGLDASWLGQELDEARVERLEHLQRTHGVHPAGEGGEYESLVLDAPLFTQRIALGRTEVIKDGIAATLSIHEAHLEQK
jgi:diphthine-ammonia ligase